MALIDRGETDVAVVLLVSLGHFFSHFYLLALPPLFPILRPEFGLSNAQLGLLVSATEAGTFLQVFAGDVVDRIGGRRVLVAGLAVTAAGIGLAGLAGSYLLLLAFALLSSLGQAGFHPADYALLDAVSSTSSKGKSFGMHTFGGSLGFAVGPAVVGGLALAFDWQVALVTVGLVGLGYAGITYVLLDEVTHGHATGDVDGSAAPTGEAADEPSGERPSLRDPTLLALFALFFTIAVATFGFQSFTPVLVVDGLGLSAATASTALSAFFGLSAVGVLVGGVLADRLRPRLVIVPALAGAGVLTWAVAAGVLPPVPVLVVAGFAGVGGVFGLLYPSRDRLVNAASASGSTGRSFGFVFTGITVAGVVGPAALGAAIDATTISTAFWLMGASLVAGAAIAFLVATHLDRRRGAPVGAD